MEISIAKLEDSVVKEYLPIICNKKFVDFRNLVMKKIKHWLVENISSDSADMLGLTRAILAGGY